jgi:hypothetical protein
VQTSTIEALAVAFRALSPADRARLATLLTESSQNPPLAIDGPQDNAECPDAPDAG